MAGVRYEYPLREEFRRKAIADGLDPSTVTAYETGVLKPHRDGYDTAVKKWKELGMGPLPLEYTEVTKNYTRPRKVEEGFNLDENSEEQNVSDDSSELEHSSYTTGYEAGYSSATEDCSIKLVTDLEGFEKLLANLKNLGDLITMDQMQEIVQKWISPPSE